MSSALVYYVFSTAGKLIYSSADEEQASTHVGVLQTLISIYADDASDRLRHISSSGPDSSTSIVFLLRPPLYLTAISTTAPTSLYPHPPPALLRIHLDALHLQLTSIVPLPKLTKLFSQRPNYDLRAKMLSGTEPFLHRLIRSLDITRPPSSHRTGTEGGWPWLLGALQPIKIDPALRSQLGSALQPPPHEQSSTSSPSIPPPAPPATDSSAPSIISSVSTVTASTLSLLNPASYLNPSPATSPQAAIKRPKDLLYVLVLFQSQLVTLLRPRKHSVHAADMHLLINAARASISSRSREGGDGEDLQSWVPVCLPRFAPGGFVWVHVSLLPTGAVADKSKVTAGLPSEVHHKSATHHAHPRRPGMPTNHVSTASAISTTSTLHVPDGLPSTSTSTAQAVASAMRSSLPSSPVAHSSRNASPSPLASRASSSTHILPISTLPSSSSLALSDPDQTVRQSDDDDDQGVAGVTASADDSQIGSPAVEDSRAPSETASIAETETEADRQPGEGNDAGGEGMDEDQEAELMASISALRSNPAQPISPTQRRKDVSQPGSEAGGAKEETENDNNDVDELTLVLVSGDPDAFNSLSLWRTHIIQTLLSKRILEKLVQATLGPSGTKGNKAPSSYSADELRIPGLRHFIYKSRTITQLTAPRFEAPYFEEDAPAEGEESSVAWRRLVGLYGVAWDGLHAPMGPPPELFGLDLAAKAGVVPAEKKKADDEEDEGAEGVTASATATATSDAPSTAQQDRAPLFQTNLTWTSSSSHASSTYTFLRTEHEAVLGWLTSAFELYVCVSPWMKRKGVVGLGSKVAGWVKEREEELFLLAPPVF
ncbi:unnamed protein product [Tilletia controversa]|uniref:Vacuolar fusion protein MON1 n=2 Tax=Tilletia TaxID=13289 RepID=A0A177VBK9_9BASI|nr:hypothetical protein CF336_g1235 [Tilletia laevis]KAE8262806.1 hypothetical protein A4X03_0g2162 [Tilletia caries]CAD6896344.1 unnamed protein product [Tilletia controversa]KAE8208060.1 hypothetical protein CF335_g691 [Tilletia laevis]CAD6893211.1 unnamed protein product [Tilletia caries]